MNISKSSCNKLNMCECEELYVEVDPGYADSAVKVIKTSRIGIDSVGEEWARKPLRFYIFNNACVSKRDKIAERDLF